MSWLVVCNGSDKPVVSISPGDGDKFSDLISENERKRVPLAINLFRQFAKNSPIQVYFEIYNLIYDIEGKTHYTVQYNVKSIEPELSANPQTVFLRQEFVGESRFEPITLAIDITKLPPGKTRLAISVEDLTVGETREKYFDFLIFE